jgi:hypothetical protein
MSNQLKGGGPEPPSFTASMAAAIESQLNGMLAEPLPAENTPEARDRRRFFAAVARGVLQHLKENPDALRVVFTQVAGPHSTSQFQAHVAIDVIDVP